MANEASPSRTGTALVNCWQCRHFASSWDPKLPYLCRFMGVKSRNLPSVDVMRLDGSACQGFAAKAAAPTTRATPSAALSEMRRI